MHGGDRRSPTATRHPGVRTGKGSAVVGPAPSRTPRPGPLARGRAKPGHSISGGRGGGRPHPGGRRSRNPGHGRGDRPGAAKAVPGGGTGATGPGHDGEPGRTTTAPAHRYCVVAGPRLGRRLRCVELLRVGRAAALPGAWDGPRSPSCIRFQASASSSGL